MKSYYGAPLIHKPHWQWLIIVYFFLGGLSSACYVIASIARLVGGQAGRPITRVGHYMALLTLIPSPVLLILDLGRPERFLNMLRVIKLRSPMSLGTWGLIVYGGFVTLSAAIQAAEDGLLHRFGWLARLLRALPAATLGALGTLPGFFVGGYTGVLLAATAVPLWAKNALLLGPLFLASALSSGAATITLVLALARGTSGATLRRLERLDVLALLCEFALLAAAYRNLGPIIGRPLRRGKQARLLRWGVLALGIALPLALQIKSFWPYAQISRLGALLASSLALLGGFALRYTIVMAGRNSADDPEATFVFTQKSE
jgi:formate-dependent nitrite reductase membrane component NrfD